VTECETHHGSSSGHGGGATHRTLVGNASLSPEFIFGKSSDGLTGIIFRCSLRPGGWHLISPDLDLHY
jgi:hypothetical protein